MIRSAGRGALGISHPYYYAKEGGRLTDKTVEPDEFRTANMALAGYLSFFIENNGVGWSNDTCYWTFPQSEQLQQLVTEFSGGNAKVDPREYSYRLTQMRKQMRNHPTTPAAERSDAKH